MIIGAGIVGANASHGAVTHQGVAEAFGLPLEDVAF